MDPVTLAIAKNDAAAKYALRAKVPQWNVAGAAKPMSVNISDPAFGAVADSTFAGDTSITSGSAVLTGVGTAWSAADVGKTIGVDGAGAAGANLATTILSRQSATQVTLATTASTTASHVSSSYGTDNGPALRAAVAFAFANGALGATVAIPSGNYVFDASSADVLALPTACPQGLVITGAGMGGTGGTSQITKLNRVGTHSFISCVGTAGTNPSNLVLGLSIRDLSIDGKAFSGKLLSLGQPGDLLISNVRLANVNDTALYTTQASNCRFLNMVINTSGNVANDQAAFVITSSGSTALTNANSVQIAMCTFEQNTWHDMLITGQASTAPAAGVLVSGCKFERSGGYAIYVGYTSNIVITNNYIYCNVATYEAIHHTDGVGTIIDGNLIVAGTSSSSNYLINFTGGVEVAVTNNALQNSVSKAAAISLIAGMAAVHIGGNTYEGTFSKFVNDARTTRSGFVETHGYVNAYGALTGRYLTGAGKSTVNDTDFFSGTTMRDGAMAVHYDSTTSTAYLSVRANGAWVKVALA